MKPVERINRAFLRAHPQQAAEILEDAPVRSVAAFLDSLSTEEAAPVIVSMLSVPAARCLAAMPGTRAAALLTELPARSALDLLRRMPRGDRDPLLALLPERRRRALRRALKLSRDTVGTLADTQVLALPGDTSVERAVRVLANHESAAECHVYILEDNARLLGAIPVRALFAAPASQRLSGIARRRVPALPANATTTGVISHPGWKHFAALPVIENDGVFIGVLRRAQLGDAQTSRSQHGRDGGLELALSLLEAYVTTSHVLLSTLGGIRQPRDRS